jgi:alkylation response protein AidB-like acyl-CoA dehydrogenase
MLLGLTDDQEFFRGTTERFLVEHAPVDALRSARDDPDGFDRAYWRRGAELGWTSLLVDEERGGGTISGAGLADVCLVAYEFGRHAAPGPLMTTNVVAAALNEAGAAGAQADVLAGLLSGETVVSWCAPVVGADGWRATVEAGRDGSNVVLRGEARAVEAAGQADHLLVTCADPAGPAAPAGPGGVGTTQVLVPTSLSGVSVTPMQTVDLTRRFGVVTFDDAVVPVEAMVGQAGTAAADVDRQLQLWMVLLNAESVGAMQTGFDMTVEWAFDRYTFGRPLASYQALKHRFADMFSWLEASHAIADASRVAVERRSPDAVELTSMAKAYIGEYGSELLQDCVQLHGGIGVTFEYDLHLYLRRQAVNRALAGTPSEHRRRIASLVDARVRRAA